MNVLTTE